MGVVEGVDHNVKCGQEGVHVEHEGSVPFPWGSGSRPTLERGHLPLKSSIDNSHQAFKAFDDAFVVASIHDELLVECNEGDAEAVAGVVEASMLEAADEILNADEPRVKIEVDVSFNKRWVKG